MKHILLLLAAFTISAVAQAAGLPFAVESLAKAQDLSRQDSSRHVLVFYSSPN